jgi:hypothetical protein
MGNLKRQQLLAAAEFNKFNRLSVELKLLTICFGFVFIAMNYEIRTV